MPSPARLIAVGIFGAAHGVRGEIRVKSYTDDPKTIGAYGALTDAVGARAFKFVALRKLKDDMLVARLAGIDDREAARALNGVEIFARREQLPPPDADEFYHADLVGLSAVTRDGALLGKVVALRNFGAGDILEISGADGGETSYLPFTRAVAPEIDLAGGRIVIEPPGEIEGEAAEAEG